MPKDLDNFIGILKGQPIQNLLLIEFLICFLEVHGMALIRFVISLFLLLVSIIPGAAQTSLRNEDLEDCSVLTGKIKQELFKDYLSKLKDTAMAGDEDDTMTYGSILHNKFVCQVEEITGDLGWTTIVETGKKIKISKPPPVDLHKYTEVAATLRESISAFERISESNLNARLLLGKYYADYDDYLKPPATGYEYIAGVYSAECRPGNRVKVEYDRCKTLHIDLALFNSMLSRDQRTAIHKRVIKWADAFIEKQNILR